MAYVKPGVSVRQVQTTVSPNLTEPGLKACIIGKGCYAVEPVDGILVYSSADLTTEKKYNNAADTTVYLDTKHGVLDSESVYVDILSSAGSWYHLSASDYSVDAINATITINSGIGTSLNNGVIAAGYQATLSGLENEYFDVESLSEYDFGKISSYNPLAFGLQQAITNAGSIVGAYAVAADTTGEHNTALEALELQEVYALAPMTHQNVHSAYASHVTLQSAADVKKERIVFLNPKWDWFESDGQTTTDGALDVDTNKTGTATGLAARAFSVGNRRVFYVNPDTVYVEETRPLYTTKQSFIKRTFSIVESYGLYAKFITPWTYKPGTVNEVKYRKGDNITDAAWAHLMDNTYGYPEQTITVLVPAPAYYLCAGLAGMVSGQEPQQGFTNLPVAGSFSQLKYSGDYLSEAQLNVLAGGGNWIMWQPNLASSIVTRHQQSTDVSSVEKRELSITKSLDFASKFIRDGVSPYIGRYNITPTFLNMIRTIITGQGTYLRREGYINDLKVDKVEQDTVSQDTILVTLSISVQYPVNYIKITLQF